jgi:hypothetical protein
MLAAAAVFQERLECHFLLVALAAVEMVLIKAQELQLAELQTQVAVQGIQVQMHSMEVQVL